MPGQWAFLVKVAASQPRARVRVLSHSSATPFWADPFSRTCLRRLHGDRGEPANSGRLGVGTRPRRDYRGRTRVSSVTRSIEPARRLADAGALVQVRLAFTSA